MGDYSIDINVNMGSGGDSNFQSLIDAVNNLNATLSKVGQMGQRAGNQTKQSFSESAQIMERFGNSVKKVQAEINSLKNQIIQQNDALRKGIITEAQHKASVDALHASLRQLQTAQRQYNSVLNQTTASAKTASGAFGGLTSAFNKLGAVLGVSFGLYGVFRVLTNIVKTIAEFDLAQKKLQSILGETATGMKELSQSAIDLGKNSIFGAKGVSELQIELAKMGFTKNEIMAMQGAINDLAIATQEDLATSAEVVANIIKVYGMTATETRDVVNVMGKAFNESALGLSNFREAIKYVAPVAKQAGFSFRETVAAMELLANAGLKGSLTGTALNNVLKAMMDSNSKLAKNMGGAVMGYEGFVDVLQRSREAGWDVQDVFGLITQRATGAYSVLMDGLPTLEQTKQALEDVSNVMRDQAAVQLESVTYSAKLFTEQWKAMVLEIDKGDGALSKTIKTTLNAFSAALWAMRGGVGDVSKSLADAQKDLDQAQGYYVEIGDKDYAKKLDEANRKLEQSIKNWQKVDQYGALSFYAGQKMMQEVGSAMEEVLSAIVKGADAEIARFDLTAEKYKDWEVQKKSALAVIGAEIKSLEDQGQKETFIYKVKQEALQQLDKLTFKSKELTQATEDNTDAEKERIKALKESYAYELEMLKLRKELEDEQIKNRLDNYEEQFALQANLYAYEVERANKELEMAIALGEDEVKAKNKYNLILEIAAIEHANKMIAIRKKMNEDLAKAEKRLLGDAMKPRDEVSSDWIKDWDKRMKDLDEFMEDFKFKNPILGKLFGQQIEENIFSGLMTEEDAEQMAKGFDLAMDKTGEFLNEYIDSWVEATDRVVDQMNRQVEELQTALQTEIELMEAGYASNVFLRQKELADAKKAREQALKEQRQAQRAQVAIETITQISSLITASAQIIKGFSAIPIIGTGLGIAAVATMLTAFAAAKSKAMQAAGINKYEHGGWIGGKRHSEGGTLIEAEHGEFMINRKSATKYRDVIEAINNDDKIELNRSYLNNMRDGIVTTRVSLDDSKELRAIRTLLEKKHKQVEYIGEYRIERLGNVTTKIKLN